MSEYQLFVNRKEQICVMQSASEVPNGRKIDVYTYSQQKLYSINLDLCKYAMSRDESICIYTNGAFLAAADSKKFALFNVKNGNYLGQINIPGHLERSKGKEEKYCMFEQTGLSLFIFDEDKLIAVHDYERSFPAVLDIYKFWWSILYVAISHLKRNKKTSQNIIQSSFNVALLSFFNTGWSNKFRIFCMYVLQNCTGNVIRFAKKNQWWDQGRNALPFSAKKE